MFALNKPEGVTICKKRLDMKENRGKCEEMATMAFADLEFLQFQFYRSYGLFFNYCMVYINSRLQFLIFLKPQGI